MTADAIKLKRRPLAQRMDIHEAHIRDHVLPVLRDMSALLNLAAQRIELLEAEVAELRSKDDTAQRLAALGLTPGLGHA